VLAHRAEPVLDVPVPQQVGECLSREDALLVADQMLRGSVAQEGTLQNVHHPTSIGAFQRGGAEVAIGGATCREKRAAP
jgi:hypothetical protein